MMIKLNGPRVQPRKDFIYTFKYFFSVKRQDTTNMDIEVILPTKSDDNLDHKGKEHMLNKKLCTYFSNFNSVFQ